MTDDPYVTAVLAHRGITLRHGAVYAYRWINPRVYDHVRTMAVLDVRHTVLRAAVIDPEEVTVVEATAAEVERAQGWYRARVNPSHPRTVFDDYELVIGYRQPRPYGEGAPHPLCTVDRPHTRHPVAVIEPGPAAGLEDARIAQHECPGWREPEPTPITRTVIV